MPKWDGFTPCRLRRGAAVAGADVHPGEPLGVAARQGGASAVLDDRGRLNVMYQGKRVGRISFDHKPYANEAHVRAGVGS